MGDGVGIVPPAVGLEVRIGHLGGRENVESKARRYLIEGRLTVRAAGPELIRAICKGTGTYHRLGYEGGAWWCSCPARGDRCCHLLALQLVTVSPHFTHDDEGSST